MIIGGGFAGLKLCKKLNPDKYEICLVDRNNFNCFPPLFYQIASSGLTSANICFPFRREFKKHRNVSYHMGHVKNIDVKAKEVTTSYETIKYDKLILAAGSTNNYFGMDSLAEETFGIKTVAEAAHTRDEILDRFERGALCRDKARRRELLTFLVVGGGPAGVEIAGALGEMKKYILKKEYPELEPDDITITLVEGTGSLLGAMRPQSQAYALKTLKKLMVNVRLNTVLKDYSDKYVNFADGQKEYYETLIWTAGVRGEPMPGLPQECVGHGNRVLVDEYNRVKGLDGSVFAVGDICDIYYNSTTGPQFSGSGVITRLRPNPYELPLKTDPYCYNPGYWMSTISTSNGYIHPEGYGYAQERLRKVQRAKESPEWFAFLSEVAKQGDFYFSDMIAFSDLQREYLELHGK